MQELFETSWFHCACGAEVDSSAVIRKTSTADKAVSTLVPVSLGSARITLTEHWQEAHLSLRCTTTLSRNAFYLLKLDKLRFSGQNTKLIYSLIIYLYMSMKSLIE